MKYALLLVAVGAAFGQTKAQLSGFVQDRSGGVVRDAAINVVNMDTGIRRAVRSNGEGFYAVSSLSAGMYKLTIRKDGFQTVARVGVPLQATEAGRLDFVLDIGSTHEVVTVTAAAPLLNVDDATSGVTMGSQPAQVLPLNGRGLQGVLELAPGVLATPANGGEAGQFSTNGQRANTNYFTVDGVSANNGISGSGLPGQFSGGALPAMTAIGSLHNLVSLAELQELRVQTSTFAPEYGRLPGAHVAVSTRSGSNDIHGEVFGSFRQTGMTSTDWFTERARLAKPQQRLVDAGGVVGGPLIRDRTFGFVSFERLDLRQPITFATVVPGLESRAGFLAAYPLPNGPDLGNGLASYTAQVIAPGRVTTGSGRLDHALGAAGSLFARYSRSPSLSDTGFLQRNRTGFVSQTVTAGLITVLPGERITNDARVSVARTGVTSAWTAGAANAPPLNRLLPPPSTSGSDEQKLYGLGVAGLAPLVAGDAGKSRQTQWNLVDTIAVPTGRHDIRLGFDYQRLTPVRDRPITSVVGEFASLRDALAGGPMNLTYAQASSGASLIETFSAFVQDTWHVSPRLNVTYGFRWEFTPPPSYRNEIMTAVISPLPIEVRPTVGPANQPVWKSRYDQWAPRAGVAYRANESGTFVVRAGAGLFYDLTFSSATDLLNGAPYNRWRNLLGPAVAPATEVSYGFAPNLKLPYSVEWNVTLERGFGADAAASAAYVGSAGRRLLRREAYIGNVVGPDEVLATNNGFSNYHALQLQGRSRSRRGLQGVVSYTWSHAIDNGSWDSGTYVIYPGMGARQDRGDANFDARHSFQAALAYKLPKGWLASGMFRARSGFPIDVMARENSFGLGFDNARPDLAGSPWIDDPNAPGGRRLNARAFRIPGSGQGSLGRNALRGFGLVQLDLALERHWELSERAQLRLRVEAYNATNRASFADPVRFLSNALFGESTSLAGLMLGAGRPNSGLSPAFQPGGPRSLQAGISVRF